MKSLLSSLPSRSFRRGIGARLRLAAVLLPALAATAAFSQSAPLSAPAPEPALAATRTDAWGITVPSWISAASVSVKEGYDFNIYGVETNLAGHPDIANISSWFTTLSAAVTADFLAATGTGTNGFLKTLSLGYSGDYIQYNAAAREDSLRNTFTLEAAGSDGHWSFSIDNPLLYVDGSKEDEFFSTYNNLGYAVVRERRNQVQERNTSFLRYDFPDWFVRATDNLQYYNLLIDEHNPVGAYKGYANWVNRGNVNAGLDFGYKLTSDFALVAGWRLGQQTQGTTNYSPVASDNTYNRALLGFEGKPLRWLQAQLLAGPDFRRYSDANHEGLYGKDHTWFYLQGQLAATLSPQDSITANEKVWHFVSSSGVSSIQEVAEGIAYKHTFTRELSASVGVSELGHRYDAPTVRDDWATTFPVDVSYAVTKGLSVSADYTATNGHSHYPVAVSPGQDFEDNIVSLTVKASF